MYVKLVGVNGHTPAIEMEPARNKKIFLETLAKKAYRAHHRHLIPSPGGLGFFVFKHGVDQVYLFHYRIKRQFLFCDITDAYTEELTELVCIEGGL